MRSPLATRPGDLGIDEAGRGPLAGPVVVAAVRLPLGVELPLFADSKKLTAASRNTMALWLRENAETAVEIVPPETIDRLNILGATLLGMERVADRLGGWAWIDGSVLPKGLVGRGEAVVKGDGKIAEIAAASILAKVTRDALMVRLAQSHPGYGFEGHFGYPTPAHLAALRALGPCSEHRRSFAPVKALL